MDNILVIFVGSAKISTDLLEFVRFLLFVDENFITSEISTEQQAKLIAWFVLSTLAMIHKCILKCTDVPFQQQ